MSKYTAVAIPVPYTTLDKHHKVVATDSLAIPDDHTIFKIMLDRTVPGGLNFQDPSITLGMEAQVSLDGGDTWQFSGSSGPSGAGGIGFAYSDAGQPWARVHSMGGGWVSGTNRLGRVVITTTTDLSPASPLGIAGVLVSDSDPNGFPNNTWDWG